MTLCNKSPVNKIYKINSDFDHLHGSLFPNNNHEHNINNYNFKLFVSVNTCVYTCNFEVTEFISNGVKRVSGLYSVLFFKF